MILRIVSLEVVGRTSLWVEFNDGSDKQVDAAPLLEGPIFAPVREPGYFARAILNPTTGTVEWPNGADLAPEALRDLPDEGRRPRLGNR